MSNLGSDFRSNNFLILQYGVRVLGFSQPAAGAQDRGGGGELPHLAGEYARGIHPDGLLRNGQFRVRVRICSAVLTNC